MNREILFKGKRKDTKEWVFGHLMQGADITLIIPKGKEFFYDELEKFAFDMTAYEVIPETVGQYTGIKDKNGKKIFEGDIIKVTNDYGIIEVLDSDTGIGVVEFYDGYWYIAEQVNNSLYEIGRCYYIEIIGNIHDTPELLEEPL